MTPVLSLSEVRKSFGGEEVLRGVSLTVLEHQATVLIGASGSGKSTLLRCVNLLETVDDGVIELDGIEITDPTIDADTVRRRIGIVFQAFNLFPHMTVLDNVTLAPIRVHGMGRTAARAEAMDLLDRFGLAAKADAYPERLSGGQQQRVAIVRALAVRPRLMLFDEGHVCTRSGARERGADDCTTAEGGRDDHGRRHPRNGIRCSGGGRSRLSRRWCRRRARSPPAGDWSADTADHPGIPSSGPRSGTALTAAARTSAHTKGKESSLLSTLNV